MAELTESLKVEIVQRLARFQPPAEIVRVLRDEYDIPDVQIRQIVSYDPTRPSFEAAKRFIDIFNIAREKFIKDVDSVPIANQGYRLNVLQELLNQHLKHKKLPEAARVVEQAAKEIGGHYSNVSTIRTPDMAKTERTSTNEEREEQLANLIDGAFGRTKPTAPGSPTAQ